MSRRKNIRYFVGDFETTVFEGQEYTEVWASAIVELFTDEVVVLHSIEDTFQYLKDLHTNIIIYYHNLKFDGAFWLDFLLRVLHFKQAVNHLSIDPYDIAWLDDDKMDSRSFKYMISDMGQFYSIKIKLDDKIIEIRDSLKLLPFSVKNIGDSFKTEHRKLDMEYKGFRYAGCEITPEEEAYIKNDVLVVKEALEIMFKQGHKKLTIGSCCYSEFKQILGKQLFYAWFPDLYQIELDPEIYDAKNAGEYIRRSYRGGWCYLAAGKENRIYKNGITVDVNSLYPSMMSAESGNYYPIRKPTFWVGPIPEVAYLNHRYFFLTIRCRFELKPGHLPFIQVKHNWLYKSTECLTTSDIRDKNGKYHRYYKDLQGKNQLATVTMTLTMTDWYLIQDHYNLYDLEILHGCYFDSRIGVFDEYIDKYKRIKQQSTGAVRTLAKLFLNNLYGKMATNKDSSFKYAELDETGVVKFTRIEEFNKKPGYIACGSAITSYSRNFTIRAAQANYHGPDKPGFIYADTDSIHCDLSDDQIKGVVLHDTDFCAWKIESHWDTGWFVRQKTYIEKTGDDYDIKCAGMPDRCKQAFIEQINQGKAKLTDFKIGFEVNGKLLPKRILGGIVLEDTTYKMR